MARRVAVGVLLLLMWAGVSDAGAQGWREWLDKLSGPGDFSGYGVAVEHICYGVRRLDRGPEAAAGTPQEAEGGQHRFSIDWNCGGASDEDWRMVHGLEFAWLSTHSNPLNYPGDPGRDAKSVTVSTIAATFDFVPTGKLAPNAWIELGAGFGIAWFDGKLFGTTSKPMLQPIRLTVKPLALLLRKDTTGWSRAVQLRFKATVFPGGFDAADFGSGKDWAVGNEFLKGLALVVDFGELRLRRR